MQKIDNIEIKNFKSIRHQKIEGCKRINVFIGEPNVGKSNILEAISGYSLLNTKSFQSNSLKTLVRFSRFTDLFFNADTSSSIDIIINNNETLIYNLSDFKTLNLFISGLGNKSTVKNNITVQRGEMYLNVLINQDGKLAYKKDVIVDYPESKPLIKKYSFNSDIEFHTSESLSLNVPFGENLNDIVEVNPELRRECNEILKEYNLNLHFDRTELGNKLELRKTLSDGTTMTLDWNLIADTLRRLFFYKAAILSNQKAVLVFEEPESHMYPSYISKFTSDMMYDDNGNQFFIATHSPYVINDIMENLKKDDYSIYTVGYDKENGETLIRRMTDEELHEIYQYGVDLFLNLENYLPHAQQQ
jgi:AAA15 family ATPase/GTPase